jgi:hypothetical protein
MVSFFRFNQKVRADVSEEEEEEEVYVVGVVTTC